MQDRAAKHIQRCAWGKPPQRGGDLQGMRARRLKLITGDTLNAIDDSGDPDLGTVVIRCRLHLLRHSNLHLVHIVLVVDGHPLIIGTVTMPEINQGGAVQG